jgi:hypothetical protein
MIKITLFLILLSINSALAGDTKGNGGNALVCMNEDSKSHLLALDHYEARDKFPHDVPPFEGESDVDLALGLLERISKLDKHRYFRMRLAIQNFYSAVKWVNFPLGRVVDTGQYSIPDDCKLYQVVNQNRNILPRGKKYLIEKDIWDKLSFDDRGVLILHEVLYFEAPNKTSEKIRLFNSFLIADKFRDFTKLEYLKFLIKNGFKKHTFSEFEIHLDKNTLYYPSGMVKKSVSVNHSLARFLGKELTMQEKKIVFAKNGRPIEFCSLTPLSHDFGFGIRDIHCINYPGEYSPLRFYQSGGIKTGAIFSFKAKHGPYNVQFGVLNRTVEFYAPIRFFPTGELNKIINTTFRYEYMGENWQLGGNGQSLFDKNKNLIKTEIINKEAFESLYGSILIRDYVEFENNTLKSSIAAIAFQLTIHGQVYNFSGKQEVSFYPNGALRTGILVSGESLEFTVDGLIK